MKPSVTPPRPVGRGPRRRLLLSLAGLGLAASTCALPAWTAESSAAAGVLVAEPLGPTTFLLAGQAGDASPPSNAGFVVTANSVVVVGAPATAADAARWLDAIRAVTPKPVSHVLLTGLESSQAGAIEALKANGAAVVARRLALPAPPPAATAGEAAEPAAVVDVAAARITADLWLEDSTDLLFSGTHLLALALGPVHGPHDMAYAVPDDGVLFAGDLLVTGRLPDVRDADAVRWLAALGELQLQGAIIAVPSRGPVSRSPQEDFQRAREYLELLRSAMGDAARSGTPFDEAYERGDWSRFVELPMFDKVNRANARHTYLQAQGTAP
jgi:glyoxylase-like metal-dependent hydrolase (beta-lactamase superfamily II)